MALAQQLSNNKVVATGRKARRQLKKLQGRRDLAVESGDPTAVAVEALWRKGAQEVKANRIAAALKTYSKIVEMNPEHAMGHRVLGQLVEMAESPSKAYPHYARAAELEPNNVEILIALGSCLTRLAVHDAAVIAFSRALEAEPFNVQLLILLARARFATEDSDGAIACYKKALELEPDNVFANFELGNQYEVKGEFGLARTHYNRVLEIDSKWLEVHVRLASMGDTPVDEQAAALEQLEAYLATDELTDETRKRCLFAGAKINQRLKNYDAAFDQFVEANGISAAKEPFDRDGCRGWFELLKASFSKEVFETHRSAGSDTEQPVFIVGMPRSGTTLTEQIISSHPLVAGAGELGKIDQLVGTMVSIQNSALRFPQDIGRFEPEGLAGLAEDYLAALRREQRGDAVRITDKYVFNFYHLGLISILFPKAKVIHCMRDPMDTCLSILFQNFSGKLTFPFWHKLEDIGFFYRLYEGLMAHWHEVSPLTILDVQYEETVADQEAMSRKLIDFVGLDWDDACLRFYENKRTVSTASVWQVRQKVYSSSVQRWRAYDKHLDPLKRELFGEAG